MFKKDNKGFTIIEVLIVLAIAGLILLIVFLAVPALQRNSRNTNRNNDAARISASITECLANRNGQIDACDDATKIGFDQDDFSEITTVSYSDAVGSTAADAETVSYGFDLKCEPEGDANTGGTSSRQFAVMYKVETSSGLQDRCIGSE